MLFFLASQSREFGVSRVIQCEERFLAVQNRWVFALMIIPAIKCQGSHVQLDRTQQRRMRIGIEIRIREVRYFSLKPVNFDDIGILNLAQVRTSATLVRPE